MSQVLPTVRVRNPAAPDSFMIINASDLTEAHDLWPEDGAAAPPDASGLRVARGPGGRWYVKRGREAASGGFGTEAEALAEIARLTS